MTYLNFLKLTNVSFEFFKKKNSHHELGLHLWFPTISPLTYKNKINTEEAATK
jgi:hypothetical protein